MQTVIVGNLTADPELRYTQTGLAVANFTIAHTPRTFDRAMNEWVDGDTLFLRCTVWRDQAQNVAGLTKGTRVLALGVLRQKSWEKDGEKRTSIELEVEELGPSARFASVSSARTVSSSDGFIPAEGAA